VRRVVYSSSSSVYGDTPTLPKHEELEMLPRSPYAASKLAGEQYVLAYARGGLVEGIALRYFNVFGPRQDPSSQYAAVVPRFIRQIADGAAVTVHGDGGQSRDFTYVENVVRANLLAADAGDAAGRVLNIATGSAETVEALADTIGRLLDRPVEKTYGPAQPGDVRESWADVSAAREAIGYEPLVGFEEGLRPTIDAMLGDSPVLMSMLLSPLSLVLISAVYCSFWPTYRDVVTDAQTQPAP
jgi:UDP-glucose 4-epimerase